MRKKCDTRRPSNEIHMWNAWGERLSGLAVQRGPRRKRKRRGAVQSRGLGLGLASRRRRIQFLRERREPMLTPRPDDHFTRLHPFTPRGPFRLDQRAEIEQAPVGQGARSLHPRQDTRQDGRMRRERQEGVHVSIGLAQHAHPDLQGARTCVGMGRLDADGAAERRGREAGPEGGGIRVIEALAERGRPEDGPEPARAREEGGRAREHNLEGAGGGGQAAGQDGKRALILRADHFTRAQEGERKHSHPYVIPFFLKHSTQ